MEEERLWKFRRPEWMNSIFARNAGIYTAGGLVRENPIIYLPKIPKALALAHPNRRCARDKGRMNRPFNDQTS